MALYPQHQRAIDRLVDRFSRDPNYLALLIGGSIAHGWAREDSDVDFMLVATGAEFARRAPAHDYTYYTTELCDYPGGYVDGKIIDTAFLCEVADRGSEPARAAFVGVWAAWSRWPELDQLLARITQYPEADRAEKIRAFYAQLLVWQWYSGEADKRDDRYLKAQAATNLVLFGGRLILAHNRILYPYHKWLMQTLQATPDKPADLMGLIDQVLADPCKRTADAFCDCVLKFATWETPPEGWPARFMTDTEWAWRSGHAPVSDW